MDFQIGELVEWTIGNNIRVIGAVLETLDKEVIVMTHYINGRLANREIKVNKKLLKLKL